jgi:hypothetical protein
MDEAGKAMEWGESEGEKWAEAPIRLPPVRDPDAVSCCDGEGGGSLVDAGGDFEASTDAATV